MDSSLENEIDSAFRFPTVIKRKLHHKEKPIMILNRTNLKNRENEGEFDWNFYFLSNSDIMSDKVIDPKYQGNAGIFNKEFHRKGNWYLRVDKNKDFREVTLTLTGDHLIYNWEAGEESDNIILLSEAQLYDSKERQYAFEIKSNRLRYAISWKSQHDRDNWVSSIIARIKHTKWKYEIAQLEHQIKKFAENSSNSEADNPTRKQFLAFLEWLPPEWSSLLISIIKSIHEYKQRFTEYNDHK